MNSTELSRVLTEFYGEKLTLRQRHSAVARQVTDYNANNTYQYVIAREDVHLAWLEAALRELEVTPADAPEPQLPPRGKKASFVPLAQEDARDAEAFVSRWRARVDAFGHARHRGILQITLGETLEHKRFFDQIAAGREDVLGRRSNGAGSPGTGDGVPPVRWIE